MDDRLAQIVQWMIPSGKVVIFTGAGLSTESGIPDFRSPGGVWDKYNPEDFYFQKFLSSETSRRKYWQMSTEMYHPMKQAEPNSAHLAIAELERLGKLDCVITQNIDGLHLKAGNSETRIIELHGNAMVVSCLKCGKRYDRDQIQERLKREEKPPCCNDCGGFLKPATISFGQSMPEKETNEAYRRSSICDLFIVIGSSLVVQPAASMPLVAKQNGARLVIVNRESTPYDHMADIVIHGQAGITMKHIIEELKKELRTTTSGTNA
jgi:NAD-dependent deacetylase